eukprot:TRINITY_DN49391_c0_g1_i1.p1 TRINITY_DN49391_c0_g1~~TRINITY_DN49391_c0_g1_i1.p1  ORF type:complete len:372 (-),score=59.55 TRINITY_DN49391_c0_g1_i1:26-1141(-)
MIRRFVGSACNVGRSTGVRSLSTVDNITQTIGRTPVVKINRLAPEGVEVYAKLEYFNPLSSVKDRLALAIIEDAERSGRLKPGGTIVEATSGNTGIALAMVCAQRGYGCVITMAESFSIERRQLMRALGAKVIITPAPDRGTGMVKKAEELATKHGWYWCRQFENPANIAYHANTTGPEILLQMKDVGLDYWVTGYGTGGTFHGAGKVIKAARPDTKIVLCEPTIAPIVSSGKPQERTPTGGPVKSHPDWTPHPLQGWTPDFIPLIVEQAMDKKLADSILTVEPPTAMATALSLAKNEGIFCGASGGGTMACALQVAKTAPKGSKILAMIPDTGERYFSTPLMKEVNIDMNEAEFDLSKSTPGYQLPPKEQ